MSKDARKPEPSRGTAPSPHRGEKHHGWAEDVDAQRQEPNPSAHRSFHPDKYAPEPDPDHTSGDRDASLRDVPSRTGESPGRSGEDYADHDEEGMRRRGRRGRSQRPSGEKGARAFTSVDPQEPDKDE
jgi:hypothetical protein